jgi:hypothetical protein
LGDDDDSRRVRMLLSSNPPGEVGKYGTWGKVLGERYCGEMIVDWLVMKGQNKIKIKGVARKGAGGKA